jgi:very-short-patch-repair endonuclease
VDEPAAYHAEGILYLPVEARFDYLLNRPEAENIGAKVNAAMRDVAKCELRIANCEVQSVRHSTFVIRISPIPATVDYDAFGRIYEYFLGEFARSEGSKGGEFYTPASIVRLLTEVIEPYHGRILDPACGSGGMFVSSARFVSEHKRGPSPAAPTPSSPTLLPAGEGSGHFRGGYDFSGLKKRARELRQKQTPAEELLWELLRDRQCCELKFRRQHQFGDYLLDFYCHEAKLAVELDGEPHNSVARQKKDAARDAHLKSQGVTSLRFENRVALQTPEVILEAIARHMASSAPSGRGAGESAPPDFSGDPARELSIHGVAKTDEAGRLCRLNLAVHGLEGEIKHGGGGNCEVRSANVELSFHE